MGTTKVRCDTSKGRLGQTAAASEQHRKNKRVKKTTERTLLRSMIDQLNAKPGVLGEITAKLLDSALAGDKDAMAFIGKYLLGNGKVSLDDLYNPSIIRKAK